MKRLVAFSAVLGILISTVLAQPITNRKWEFSAAISFTSFRLAGQAESETALNLPFRIGYYIWRGLEIEPEVMLTKFKGSDVAYLISGNVAYNFKIKSAFVPFVLAGIGFGNGLSYVGIVDGYSGAKSTALHLGAGIKCVLGASAALRLEYRYTHYRISDEIFGDSTYNAHQILCGVSLFF